MTSLSTNYIPIRATEAQTVRCEVSNDGKALVLHNAIYDPNEGRYFNIHIARPETDGLWSYIPLTKTAHEGDPFSSITYEKIRKIQETYIEALKRIESRPSDNPVIITNRRCTKYRDNNHAERTDSETDAASFANPEKKIHQLIVDGILNPLGSQSIQASSEASKTPLPNLPVAEGGACKESKPPLATGPSDYPIPVAKECVTSPARGWPTIHFEIRKAALPTAPDVKREYEAASFAKRRAMLIEHLNKVDSTIPFSAFRNNSLKEIDEHFFDRLKQSLERIAKNPAGRGACLGRSKEQESDDAKMWGVLIRWKAAAYEYLKKNGGRLEGMEPDAIPPHWSGREATWCTRSDQKKSEAWSKESPWHWIPYLPPSILSQKSDPLSLELAKELIKELNISDPKKKNICSELELKHAVK